MKKIAIAAIVGALVVVGGAKFYLWYEISSTVNTLIELAKPFAKIEYEKIDTTMDGAIVFTNINIEPHALDDQIHFDEFRLEFKDFMYLLKDSEDLTIEDIPNEFAIEFTGFKIDLFKPMGRALFPMEEDLSEHEQTVDNDTPADFCAHVSQFGRNQLLAMGYDKFVIDARIEEYWNKETYATKHKLDISVRDLASVSGSISLDNDIEMLKKLFSRYGRGPLSRSPMKLTHADLTFNDRSFLDRFGKYCAELVDKDVNTFIDDYIAKTLEKLPESKQTRYANDFQTYRAFLRQPSTIKIDITPRKPLDYKDLQFYAPADALKIMGFSMAFNGTAIEHPELEFEIVQNKVFDDPIKQAEEQKSEDVFTPKRMKSVAKLNDAHTLSADKSYQVTSAKELKNYVGWPARVKTKSGQEREGKIKAVKADSVTLDMRLRSGSYDVHVPFKDVVEAQVYR